VRVRVRFGRYETLAHIASGGMAAVYLGRVLGAGGFERVVAIKAMHKDFAQDPTFVAMFLDEARLAARVRHPNVVATLDVQEGPSGLYIVMEYVEGPSLSAVRRALGARGERIPLGVALRILVDALLGLHAAHEQTGPDGAPLHIVHRDVTPQNILVSVDGVSKITDFGVARAESRLSQSKSGSIKGKLAYMPPQQVRAEPLDRRADVYAAGVVLWELLVGQRLFQADNDGALLYHVMGGAQRSPREAGADVPEVLDRAVMRALALDVEARYPSALAFAEALEGAAAEASILLASPRVVATFVKGLGAHQPFAVAVAAEAPKVEASTLTAGAPAPEEELGSAGVATHVEGPGADMPAGGPPAPDSLSSPGTGVMASEVSNPTPGRRAAWRRSLVLGAAAGIAGAALTAVFFVRFPSRSAGGIPEAPPLDARVTTGGTPQSPASTTAPAPTPNSAPQPTVLATASAGDPLATTGDTPKLPPRRLSPASPGPRATASALPPVRREKSFEVP
jgi:serine/threonine-protein kinase